MKILNLYAGIGGNRKLWGNEHEITAVEYREDIACVYRNYFPNDRVIIGDAHKYLIDNFKKFDFIWSSPPCPSHSRLNTATFPKGSRKYEYPDMKLYEEIIFLKHWFKGSYCVENVIPYYESLIPATLLDRHLFWTNFKLTGLRLTEEKKSHEISQIPYLQDFLGFDLTEFSIDGKRQVLRNCVIPELGLHILKCALGKHEDAKIIQQTLF
jgi:DNA (cytosine-5)-methyltransferase 1